MRLRFVYCRVNGVDCQIGDVPSGDLHSTFADVAQGSSRRWCLLDCLADKRFGASVHQLIQVKFGGFDRLDEMILNRYRFEAALIGNLGNRHPGEKELKGCFPRCAASRHRRATRLGNRQRLQLNIPEFLQRLFATHERQVQRKVVPARSGWAEAHRRLQVAGTRTPVVNPGLIHLPARLGKLLLHLKRHQRADLQHALGDHVARNFGYLLYLLSHLKGRRPH